MDTRPPVVLSPRNRNISQSTGLAKFNLSPKKPHLDSANDAYALRYEPPRLNRGTDSDLERKASFHRARSVFDGSPIRKNPEKNPGLRVKTPGSRKPKASSPFRPTFAVEKTVEKEEFGEEKTYQTSNRNELLSKYAAKQTKLMDLNKQKELLEFEILEIEAQLQKSIGTNTFMDSMYAKANTEVKTLKNKVSTLFQNGPDPLLLRKTASSIFNPGPETPRDAISFFSPKAPATPGSSLRKTASSIFSPPASLIPNHDLKKKASAMLNTKFVSDVRDKIDQQQNEIEELTKKGTEFARNLLLSLSSKKESRESFLADSSFLVDNLGELSVADRSVVLSEDGYVEEGDILGESDQSGIDIDDYDSDSEKENY